MLKLILFATLQELCSLLEDEDIMIITIGDSLVRHATQALISLLSLDFEAGALSYNGATDYDRDFCKCDNAYDEKRCRFFTAAHDANYEMSLCPSWTKARILFKEW